MAPIEPVHDTAKNPPAALCNLNIPQDGQEVK